MYHFFDIELAKMFGVNCAIFISNFVYWITKNKANNSNFYDGRYWTFNSKKAFSELFPYLSEKQIRTTLDKLIEEGIIMVGNYNKSSYDRTLWYAFTDYGESICMGSKIDMSKKANAFALEGQWNSHNGQMDKPHKANGIALEGQPIPNNKPYINEDINKDIYEKKTRFVKPTLEQIKEYCAEKGYTNIDAEKFYLYYEQCGWTVGKNKPMKDWKASLRLWNMNQAQYQEKSREQSKVASLYFSNEECEKKLKDEVIPF